MSQAEIKKEFESSVTTFRDRFRQLFSRRIKYCTEHGIVATFDGNRKESFKQCNQTELEKFVKFVSDELEDDMLDVPNTSNTNDILDTDEVKIVEGYKRDAHSVFHTMTSASDDDTEISVTKAFSDYKPQNKQCISLSVTMSNGPSITQACEICIDNDVSTVTSLTSAIVVNEVRELRIQFE